MAENVKEKSNSSKKLVVILIIVIVVLVVGGGAAAMIILGNKDDTSAEAEETTLGYGMIGYAEAAVPINEEAYADRIRQIYEEAADGYLTLQYQNTARSDDGVHFTCEIGNSAANHYDMYFNIYLDQDFEEQILLTGLYRPGTGIEEFESEIPLDPGTYEAVLVLTLVGDDHATLKGQSYVVLNLVVSE